MAAQSQTAARQHTIPDVQKLRNIINDMDCLSQIGFLEISAVAKLALSHLETPDCYRDLENIANAFHVIAAKANDIRNCIGVEAEGVGCGYSDDAQRRRLDARRVHRETTEGVSHE